MSHAHKCKVLVNLHVIHTRMDILWLYYKEVKGCLIIP
jgi:hypothetical protein